MDGGAAAAVDAGTGQAAGPSAPLHPGNYVELYLTGLGATTAQNGFDYAVVQPAVMIGGQKCPVSYAGAAPGFDGLDQINCIVPAGLGSEAQQPLVVTSVTANGACSSVLTYVEVQ